MANNPCTDSSKRDPQNFGVDRCCRVQYIHGHDFLRRALIPCFLPWNIDCTGQSWRQLRSRRLSYPCIPSSALAMYNDLTGT